jgi:hypothetical protein
MTLVAHGLSDWQTTLIDIQNGDRNEKALRHHLPPKFVCPLRIVIAGAENGRCEETSHGALDGVLPHSPVIDSTCKFYIDIDNSFQLTVYSLVYQWKLRLGKHEK